MLALGTPIADGLWIGAVIAAGRQVLAIKLAGDVDDPRSYRLFDRSSIVVCDDVAHVIHADTAAAVASWARPVPARTSRPAAPREPSYPAMER